MKKRVLCISICLILCAIIPLSALAAVPATPNRKLYFRTGPNTKYVELHSMPSSTELTAIEYEEGNGVTWVLVEFMRDGQLDRAYTGLKRMTVHGDILWADHLNEESSAACDCSVYAGPGYYYINRTNLYAGQYVTILRYEGDYAFIEFYDEVNGDPTRGWVYTSNLNSSAPTTPQITFPTSPQFSFPSAPQQSAPQTTPPPVSTPIQVSSGTLVIVSSSVSVALYADPDVLSTCYCYIPSGTVMTSFGTSSNGFIYVQYGSYNGFVSRSNLSLY